jgi:hypothetical protein
MSILLESTAIRPFGMDLCHLKGWFSSGWAVYTAQRSSGRE